MNKTYFLSKLQEQLALKMNQEEVAKTIDYYEGYISEAIEFGLSEEEAVSQLGDIEEIVNQVVEGLKNENIDITKYEILNTNDIHTLSVDVKNTSLVLEYGNYDEIEVYVNRQYQKDYLMKKEDGCFIVKQINTRRELYFFNFSVNDESRRMVIRIPSQYDLTLDVRTSNSRIELKGSKATVHTKPCSFETTNVAIKMANHSFSKLYLMTKNAKIELDSIYSHYAHLKTTNAKVYMHQCQFDEVNTQTTNAKIELEDIMLARGNFTSTNGKIYCRLARNNLGKSIGCYTTNGYIRIDHEKINENAYVYQEGNTDDMIINFNTTNASIEIYKGKN